MQKSVILESIGRGAVNVSSKTLLMQMRANNIGAVKVSNQIGKGTTIKVSRALCNQTIVKVIYPLIG